MLIEQDPRFRKVPAELLLSPEHSQFTSDIFFELGGPSFRYYLHRSSGPVEIGGGEFGSQIIDTIRPSVEFIDFAVSSLRRLGSFLDIDFELVSDVDSASFAFFVDSEINIGSGLTLGLAVPNSSSDSNWWEVFLNGPAMQDDFPLFQYAYLHEAGHLLGLEHPFDSSDGDRFVSSRPLRSAYPEETVMAYRDPIFSSWPTWYSPSDIDALISFWGIREFDSDGALSSNRSALTALRSDSAYDTAFGLQSDLVSHHVGGRFVHLQRSDRYVSRSVTDPVLYELNSGMRWDPGYVARNVGAPGSLGTGQVVSVEGLLRNQVTLAIESNGAVGLSMPEGFNSALFVDDIFSESLPIDPVVGSADHGRSSMLQGVTDIFMSTDGGTSLVDLTSSSIEAPPVVAWGATDGLSMFWGGASSDRFIGGGGDGVIFGGAGCNSYSLGQGREVLQYRAGVSSSDLVYNFDWNLDSVELWSAAGEILEDPVVSFGSNILTMEWGSNVVDFVLGVSGVPDEINIKHMNVS